MGAVSRKEESLRASNLVHTRSIRVAGLADNGSDSEVAVFSTGEGIYDFGGTLLKATWQPDAAFTHDDTNYFVLGIQQYGEDDDDDEWVAKGDPVTYLGASATDGVAFRDIDLGLPILGLAYLPGETFTFTQHQAADGLAIPAGLLTLAFVPNSDEE